MKNSGFPIKFFSIFFVAGVMLALYASSLYRYVLFHSLVEMFSIIVAFVIFVLAWNTRRLQDNHYFLFIGIASLFSGVLDLAHTFSYKGIGVFTGHSEDLATQLWIAFRYVFSLSFLVAPFFIARKLKAPRIFAVYFFITSLLLVTIFLRRFPACYVEGTGLTPFKIISEYIISFIFLASLGLLLRKRSAFNRGVLRLVVLSLLSSIASELSFTHYVSVYGFANMLGHYFELLSYYLIYRAIIVTGVVEPSNLLFRNLKLSETALRESEAKYRSLFENMIDGFAYHKVILEETGRPVDYVFLEVNSAFERLTGLKREDIAGKRVREVLPGIENDPADWIGTYGRVALTGKEIRFEQYAGPLDKWYSITAYSPMKEYFVAVFEEITERKKAEEALRASEEQFRTLAESIPNLAWWANGDGYITWYNRRWYEYTGTTPEQMEGWGWQSVHDPNMLPKVLERWKASIATGQPFDMEFPLRGADGVFRSFLTRVLPLKDSAGQVRRWFGTNTDISALKVAEDALRKAHAELETRVRERTAELANTVNTLQTEVSERLRVEQVLVEQSRILEAFYKHSAAPLVFLDKEFNFIRVNDAYAKACSREVSDFQGHNHFADYPSDELKEKFARVVETKEPFSVFARPFSFPDHPEWGVSYWDLFLYPILDGSGKVDFLVFSLHDVTERKRAEETIRLASAYNRSLIEASLDPLVTIDATGKITDVNAATEKVTGNSREVLIGTDFSDYFMEPEKARAGYRQVFQEGLVKDYALEIRHRDGHVTPVLYNAVVYHDEAGKVTGVFAAARDITERKRAEDRIFRLNRLYSVLSKINEAIVRIHDPEKLYEQVCRIAVEDGLFKMAWIGLTEPETLMVKPVASWGDTGGYLDHIKIYAADVSEGRGPTGTAVLEGTYSICSDIEHDKRMLPWRDKALRHGFRSSAALPLRAGSAIIGAFTIYSDTPQFFTDDEINLLTSLVDDISFAIDSMANEKERVRLAAAVESVAEAVVVTDGRGIVQYVNPAFEQITGYAKEETVGRDLHILDSGKQDADFYRGLRETMKRDGVWTGRLTNKRKDGTLYEEECTYSPIKGPSGEIINYVSIRRDVTERLRLESVAEAVNTMDSIGYIFSGVRHEIGNPINSINMILGILRSKLDGFSKENIREYVDRMAAQLLNIEDLLKSLKSFNMYETLERQDVQLSSFIEKFLPLVKEDFQKKGIPIDTSVDAETKRVYADPRALQQVLLNILTNASDAMNGKKDPKVTINVSRAGNMTRIRVEDNGCGIPEEKLKDLFRPFYTTKTHGTGLGLVIVKKMLAKMNGTIEITSRKDEGTRVDIFIPEGKE